MCLSYICIVMGQGIEFLSCKEDKQRVKHVALTGFLRRKWIRDGAFLENIVSDMDVSPYLGALPPELRNRLPKDDVARVTYEFRNVLEDFLVKNIDKIRKMDGDCVYDLGRASDLFGTPCQLLSRGVNVYGVNPWRGGFGFVCKLSFPEINAHYALKLFDVAVPLGDKSPHGILFEVSTALAASHAEPCDNNRFYMASLKSEKYMLTAWAGDDIDRIQSRANKNEIFWTSERENEDRNRRNGRRIDWGETYQTEYGSLSYPMRKLWRQIESFDASAVEKTIASAQKNVIDFKEAKGVIERLAIKAFLTDDKRLEKFVDNIKLR